MQIAIIGTGNVGAALGKRWADVGHDILFGVRDAASPRATSAVAAAGTRARPVSVGEAARAASVVVLATPYSGTEAAIAACGNLADKIVADCTNSLAVGRKNSARYVTLPNDRRDAAHRGLVRR